MVSSHYVTGTHPFPHTIFLFSPTNMGTVHHIEWPRYRSSTPILLSHRRIQCSRTILIALPWCKSIVYILLITNTGPIHHIDRRQYHSFHTIPPLPSTSTVPLHHHLERCTQTIFLFLALYVVPLHYAIGCPHTISLFSLTNMGHIHHIKWPQYCSYTPFPLSH